MFSYLTGGGAARTLGYYEPGDGGGAIYNIVEDDTLVGDGGSVHDLDNGLKAKLNIDSHILYIQQFGVHEHDDISVILNNIISKYSDIIINGRKQSFVLTQRVTLNSNIIIEDFYLAVSSSLKTCFYGEHVSNIKIKDCTLNGNKIAQIGIHFLYGKNIEITDCVLYNFESVVDTSDITTGIRLYICTFSKISNTEIYNIGNTSSASADTIRGILLIGSKNIQIDKYFIHDIYNTLSSGDGIQFTAEGVLEGHSNNIVTNSVFSDCRYRCIKIQQHGVIISNNRFINGNTDILAKQSIIAIYDNDTSILNNFFQHKANNPITFGVINEDITIVSNITIDNNIIYHLGTSYQGAISEGNCEKVNNVKIVNNKIFCPAGNETENGISIRASYENIFIDSNYFENVVDCIDMRYTNNGYTQIRNNITVTNNTGKCKYNFINIIDTEALPTNFIVTNNSCIASAPLGWPAARNTVRVKPNDIDALKNYIITNNNVNSIFTDGLSKKGTTANRPTNINQGFMYYDTTLNKPIWYNGTDWVDATGTNV